VKYSCNDCGREYDRKPNFCDCGNDTFSEIYEDVDFYEEQESKPYSGSISGKKKSAKAEKKDKKLVAEDEKTNPLTVLFLIIVIAALAYFIPRYLQQKANEANDEDAKYLDRIMQTILSEFSPAGIKSSDYCTVRFEINEAGWVSKREFTHRSSIPTLNAKVALALKKATILEKPPKKYTDVPLRLNVSCTADENVAECMSGIKIDDTPTLPEKK